MPWEGIYLSLFLCGLVIFNVADIDYDLMYVVCMLYVMCMLYVLCCLLHFQTHVITYVSCI